MSHVVYTNRLILRNETAPAFLRRLESSNTLRGQKTEMLLTL